MNRWAWLAIIIAVIVCSIEYPSAAPGDRKPLFPNFTTVQKIGTGGDGNPTWRGSSWPGGSHTIQDPAGNNLTQRSVLQCYSGIVCTDTGSKTRLANKINEFYPAGFLNIKASLEDLGYRQNPSNSIWYTDATFTTVINFGSALNTIIGNLTSNLNIYIPDGIYYTKTKANLNKVGLVVHGSFDKSVLFVDPSVTSMSSVLDILSNNVTVEGIKIDGNVANHAVMIHGISTGNSLDNIRIKSNIITGMSNAGIILNSSNATTALTNSKIEGNIINNTGNMGILLYYGENIKITDNIVKSCGLHNIGLLAGGTDGGSGRDWINKHNNNVVIDRNYVNNAVAPTAPAFGPTPLGFMIAYDGGDSNIKITNNICEDNRSSVQDGIGSNDYSPDTGQNWLQTSPKHTGILIANNVVKYAGLFGIDVSSGTTAIGNRVYNPGAEGMVIINDTSSNFDDILVSNNVIVDGDETNYGNRAAISVGNTGMFGNNKSVTFKNVVIDNNSFVDTRVSKRLRDGIYLNTNYTTFSGLKITNNKLSSHTTNAIFLNGSSSKLSSPIIGNNTSNSITGSFDGGINIASNSTTINGHISSDFSGGVSSANVISSVANTGIISGHTISSIFTGSGGASLTNEVRGVSTAAYNGGSTAVSSLTGNSSFFGALSTGNITNAYGMKIEPYSPGAGVITNGIAYFSDIGGGTVGGSITNKYHFYGTGNHPSYFGGLVESAAGGYKFPDTTIQTTAAIGLPSMSGQADKWLTNNGTTGVWLDISHQVLTNTTTGDQHTQYALLAGRSTPQQFNLGTASGASTGYFSSTAHATKGKYFLNAAGTFTVDEANIRLGIGTASPADAIDISGGSTAASTVRSINTAASGAGGGGGLLLQSDDGAAMASGDRLGYVLFGGAWDTSHTTVSGAGIFGYADENWTTSAVGSALSLQTVTAGGTTRTERLRIQSNGIVMTGPKPSTYTSTSWNRKSGWVNGARLTAFRCISTTLAVGTVVQTHNTQAFGIKAAVANSATPIGVVFANVSGSSAACTAGRYCWVADSGVVDALIKNSTTCNPTQVAIVSDTAGRVVCSSAPDASIDHWKEIGHPLDTTAGGTDVLIPFTLHFNSIGIYGLGWWQVRRRREYWTKVLKG